MLSSKLILKIKEEILGEDYDLSFSYIEKGDIKKLNNIYRKKNEPTDILSFELSKKNGEMLICKEIAKEKSKNFDMTYKNYIVFLIIHGMLHLKGMEHSKKMELEEKKYLKKFI